MSHRRMWLEGGMNEEQEWIKGKDEEGTKEEERKNNHKYINYWFLELVVEDLGRYLIQ